MKIGGLGRFIDLESLFRKCDREQKKRPEKFELVFVLVNWGSRVEGDLAGGIVDVKISKDKIQFVGKSYDDPRVTICFDDVEAIRCEHLDTKVVMTIEAEGTIFYKNHPGPD